MKTFETEKNNIPEGATHTYDYGGNECGYYREVDGNWFYWGWSEAWCVVVDNQCFYEAIPIPQTNIETPEEKDIEWSSGDKCIYNGDEFLFVGMIPTLNDFSCVIFSDTHGAKRATTIELSKPETEAERVERERLEWIEKFAHKAKHVGTMNYKDILGEMYDSLK